MAGGIYSGLGRGIQDALQMFLAVDQQQKQEKRQGMLDERQRQQMDLADRLAREQHERQTRDADFNQRFRVLGQTPIGTKVDPEQVETDTSLGLGHFYKPEMTPGVNLHTSIDINPDGSTRSTGSQPFIDPSATGRGEFIGFEDTRSRTALDKIMADAARNAANNQTRITTTQMNVEQRDRAVRAMTAARQQVAGLTAQRNQLMAAGQTLEAARLDAQIQHWNNQAEQAARMLEVRSSGQDILGQLLMGDDAPAAAPAPPPYRPTPIQRPPVGGGPNPNDPLGVFGK